MFFMLAVLALCAQASFASWTIGDAFTGNSPQWQLGSMRGNSFVEYDKNVNNLSFLTGGVMMP